MRVNVSLQLREPVGSTWDYEFGDDEEIQGQAEFLRTDDGILVRGVFVAPISQVCGRCGLDFERNASFAIEEEYFQAFDVFTGAGLDVASEDDQFSIDGLHTIDLCEALRQYCLLAVPIKPLCNSDCAGLCDLCGVNWNFQTCLCEAASNDGVWEPLKSIKNS